MRVGGADHGLIVDGNLGASNVCRAASSVERGDGRGPGEVGVGTGVGRKRRIDEKVGEVVPQGSDTQDMPHLVEDYVHEIAILFQSGHVGSIELHESEHR